MNLVWIPYTRWLVYQLPLARKYGRLTKLVDDDRSWVLVEFKEA